MKARKESTKPVARKRTAKASTPSPPRSTTKPPARGSQARGRRGGDVTRERILAGALDAFATDGFDGTTTRAIAARAGVNLGLIKYYFDTKEKLWRAAVDRVFEALWERVDRARATDVADRASLESLVREVVRFAAENPGLIRLMNDEGKRDSPRLRWLTERHGKRLYERTCVVLGALRAGGALADVSDVHLFYIFIGAIGMIFSQAPECRRLGGTDPCASPELIEAHADAVIATLLR